MRRANNGYKRAKDGSPPLHAIMSEPPMDKKTHQEITQKRVASRRLAEDAKIARSMNDDLF